MFILYFSTGHHCALICSVHVNTRTCTVLYEFCVFPGLVFMLYFSTGRLCALICSVNVNTRTCTVLSEQRLMETTVIPGIYANTELCGLASGGRSADQWEPEVEEKFLIQCWFGSRWLTGFFSLSVFGLNVYITVIWVFAALRRRHVRCWRWRRRLHVSYRGVSNLLMHKRKPNNVNSCRRERLARELCFYSAYCVFC